MVKITVEEEMQTNKTITIIAEIATIKINKVIVAETRLSLIRPDTSYDQTLTVRPEITLGNT